MHSKSFELGGEADGRSDLDHEDTTVPCRIMNVSIMNVSKGEAKLRPG